MYAVTYNIYFFLVCVFVSGQTQNIVYSISCNIKHFRIELRTAKPVGSAARQSRPTKGQHHTLATVMVP